jgi:hypothetical protein
MGEVGTKLVFENERVIDGGTLEVTRQGRVERRTLEAGRVYWRERGDTHGAKNVGPARYHEILVELKP